jgi:hypothetical protein
MDAPTLHEWLLSRPTYPRLLNSVATSQQTAPYSMPEVQPPLFPISLATAPDMLQRMLDDLPRRLQPYANPAADSAVTVHASHWADAVSMLVCVKGVDVVEAGPGSLTELKGVCKVFRRLGTVETDGAVN